MIHEYAYKAYKNGDTICKCGWYYMKDFKLTVVDDCRLKVEIDPLPEKYFSQAERELKRGTEVRFHVYKDTRCWGTTCRELIGNMSQYMSYEDVAHLAKIFGDDILPKDWNIFTPYEEGYDTTGVYTCNDGYRRDYTYTEHVPEKGIPVDVQKLIKIREALNGAITYSDVRIFEYNDVERGHCTHHKELVDDGFNIINSAKDWICPWESEDD